MDKKAEQELDKKGPPPPPPRQSVVPTTTVLSSSTSRRAVVDSRAAPTPAPSSTMMGYQGDPAAEAAIAEAATIGPLPGVALPHPLRRELPPSFYCGMPVMTPPYIMDATAARGGAYILPPPTSAGVPPSYQFMAQQQQQQIMQQETMQAAASSSAASWPQQMAPGDPAAAETLSSSSSAMIQDTFRDMEQQVVAEQERSAINPSKRPAPIPMTPEDLMEWKDNILGREWEIFWMKEEARTVKMENTTAATAETTAVSDEAMVAEGASSQSEVRPPPVAEPVEEEGDDEDVPLAQMVEQRRQQKSAGAAASCNKMLDEKDVTGSDDEGSLVEHEEDWYDAAIQSFSHKDEDGSLFYNIVFVGDDKTYVMKLSPEIVRPSARAWIRRTRAMLQQPENSHEILNVTDWEQSLPPDTSTVPDKKELASIHKKVQEAFPIVCGATHPSSDENEKERLDVLQRQHVECCHLTSLIRCQVYLRTRLARTEESSVDEDSEDNEDEPTELFLDFLVNCLKDLEHACSWHSDCWRLLHRLFAADRSYQQKPSISREKIVDECLSVGRSIMATILSITDTSAKVAKVKLKGRKRQAPATGAYEASFPVRSSSARQRAKRRRKSRSFSDHWLHPSREVDPNVVPGRGWDDDDEEDLLSADTVNLFVEHVCKTDKRWFARYFGDLLQCFSKMVVAPYIKWERRAQFFLGERDTLDEVASDGETTAEDISEDDHYTDETGRLMPKQAPKRRFVKYEEIEALVESANNDRLNKCFAWSDYVTKLCAKLASIDSFETRAWDQIPRVFDDCAEANVGDRQPWDPERDRVQSGLKILLQEAVAKDGPFENMDVIGRASSSLSRTVIENAMVHRAWFLDLLYAESVRERVTFVDAVVSRLSKLPPLPSRSGSHGQNSTDISMKLDLVAPRVRALSAKYLDHVALFSRYQSMLTERVMPKNADNRRNLLTNEGARDALQILQKLPVISAAEEMLAIRVDTLDWECSARDILSNAKPTYAGILGLKHTVDKIREGRSATRDIIRKGKKPNNAIEAEMKAFAYADIDNLCGELYSQTVTLFAGSSAWKERVDSAISVLRAFGNTMAGATLPGSAKPASMVDLKRIEDLVAEYSALDVDISEDYERLVVIRDAAVRWSWSVSNELLNESLPFEKAVAFVEKAGEDRPAGIIMDPTRHVFDLLAELLRWHADVKRWTTSEQNRSESAILLLITGLEVVDRFSKGRRGANRFLVPSDALELLQTRLPVGIRKGRPLSVSRLESSSVSRSVLSRMVDKERDDKEGGPILLMLLTLWAIYADSFVSQCYDMQIARRSVSLEEAQKLKRSVPSDATEVIEAKQPHLRVADFYQLLSTGEAMEQAARTALATSKTLLRQTSQRMVEEHLNKLKEICADFKSRWTTPGTVTLDHSLEQSIEKDIKLFGWLERTFPYPALHSDDHLESSQPIGEEDKRVRWETLVTLHDRIPTADIVLGDFACVVLRVKELYTAASQWQQDISELTMLSKRGGKRRSQNSLPPGVRGLDFEHDADTASTIDVGKVAELSNSTVLSKVVMPREKGIRTMLVNTQNFEAMLFRLLGEDYSGESPDRVAIPDGKSLLHDDGTFLLFRLTGSPLFEALRDSIKNISLIASDVLANTPGKAAFEWIHHAFEWIDSLRESVVASGPQSGGACQLCIPEAKANELLQQAESIFFDFPEDLRRTLSDHMITISTKKDGKLTVTSRKGGAHHAVGSTCIRWCPFLYDALKHDLLELHEWEKSLNDLEQAYLKNFREFAKDKPKNDLEVLLRTYDYREQLAVLLGRAADLVVAPTRALISQCRTSLANLEKYLDVYSTKDAAKCYADTRYLEGESPLHDRHKLLEALVGRKIQTKDARGLAFEEVSRQGPFRDAGRTLLVKALQKAIEVMEISNVVSANSYCAIKAWEIENALFDLYQRNHGESQISPEYREKARALRRALEDTMNISLVNRVLIGKLSPENLVKMSIDELANASIKEDRAKAAAAARQNFVLTGKAACPVKKPQPKRVSRNAPLKPPHAGSIPVVQKAPHAVATELRITSKEFAQSGKPATSANVSSPTNNRQTMKRDDSLKSSRPPPPPPPSLVMPLKSVMQRETSDMENNYVLSRSGEDRFFFFLAEGKFQFFARLLRDSALENTIDGLLPDQITQNKGRVKIPELTKFMRQKISGGRWKAVALKLSPIQDEDAYQYKAFYKEYEGLERIALFEYCEQTKSKAFLITPKFQKFAGGLSFEKPHSSYFVCFVAK